MAAIRSLFNFEENPSLLPQLAVAAKNGLEQTPKSFKSLENLAKFFEIPNSGLENIPLPTIFQNHPGALARLTPLSERYIEKLAPIQEALASPQKEILKPLMQALCSAHTAYRNQFITEYQRTNPYEPFTILKQYPETIKVYLTAFFEQLKILPPEQYDVWKEGIASRSEEFLPLFSRLAILRALETPNAKLPELFDESAILPLRAAYQQLKPEEKTDLRASLLTQPNQGLAQTIARLACSIQLGRERCGFNGALRFVYEEASKSFALLDQIHPKQCPSSFELQCRTVFLALLKQENLESENLPLIFAGEELKNRVLQAFENYQKLQLVEKEKFDLLFLEKADDSDTPVIYDLLQDWKEIYFYWISSYSIPLHLLAL